MQNGQLGKICNVSWDFWASVRRLQDGLELPDQLSYGWLNENRGREGITKENNSGDPKALFLTGSPVQDYIPITSRCANVAYGEIVARRQEEGMAQYG
ncbi:MAG: hypothetical protein ACI97A_001272 [Planctomycetota bacterium]